LKILEARFKVAISREEYEKSATPGAHKWADMSGLKWKIYGFDDETSMATGIYLFEDVEVMKTHMENLKKMEKAADHASDLEMQVWDIQESLSKITKGPI
jgi:hypothetical protein